MGICQVLKQTEPLTGVGIRRPVFLAGPIPADLYLDFFPENSRKTRKPEGCEAFKSTKKSEPIFLKSVMGDVLMGDQVPGGE